MERCLTCLFLTVVADVKVVAWDVKGARYRPCPFTSFLVKEVLSNKRSVSLTSLPLKLTTETCWKRFSSSSTSSGIALNFA